MNFFHKVLEINKLRTEFRLFGILILLVCLFFCGCRTDRSIGKSCVEEVSFESMTYSKMLRLGKSCGRDVAEIRSVVGRDTLVKRFVLLEKAGLAEKAERQEEWGGSTKLNVPLERVVSLSSSQIGFMARLGVIDRIALVGEGKYIVDSTLYGRVMAGDISEVGNGQSLSLEKLLAARPNFVMTFATGGSEDDYERLEAVGIPLMLTSEWQEESPLAKFEWIRLFGRLFGAGSADSIFEQSRKSYEKMRKEFAKVADSTDKPCVLVGMSYGGVWYAPGGRSYTAQLIRDAGGRYLWESDTTREMKLSLEEVFMLADSADVWLNPGMFSSVKEILAAEPRVKKIKALREGRVYQNDGVRGIGGGNDFYEGAVAHPVELLQNVHDCLFGEKVPDSGAISILSHYKWYRNIYNF